MDGGRSVRVDVLSVGRGRWIRGQTVSFLCINSSPIMDCRGHSREAILKVSTLRIKTLALFALTVATKA